MNLEDYNEYYIQGSDHYLIPKDIFEELFDEMSNWRGESKQLKEVIEEVREYITSYDVFKEFSFPLMKREEENQTKSSIKYEFDTSIKKELLQILDKAKDSDD